MNSEHPAALPSELRISMANYSARGHSHGGFSNGRDKPERVVRQLLDQEPDDPARSAFIDSLILRRSLGAER
jgi:hypothetical protein